MVPIEVEIVLIEVEIVPIGRDVVAIEGDIVAIEGDVVPIGRDVVPFERDAVRAWLDNPPGKDVDPELLAKRTTNLATEIVQAYAHTIDPRGEELKAEEEKLQREEERRQRAREQRKRRWEQQEQQADDAFVELLAAEGLLDDEQPAEDEESPGAG